MTEVGIEVVNKLKIIPIQIMVEQHVYYSYACKVYSEIADEGCETPFAKVPHEKSVISSSFATPKAIAHIMHQKFVMCAPIYQQKQKLKRQGIHLSRQTMCNWILKASELYLTPVYEQLHKELVKREVLHCDENHSAGAPRARKSA